MISIDPHCFCICIFTFNLQQFKGKGSQVLKVNLNALAKVQYVQILFSVHLWMDFVQTKFFVQSKAQDISPRK